MARHALLAAVVLCAAVTCSSAAAAVPSEQLLPHTTKGFLSLPDTADLTAKFDTTQLGQLVNDPVMQPFVEDLKRQLKSKLGQTGTRLSITLDDLNGIAGGEVAIAVIQPDGDKKLHAIAAIVDITGHEDKATELLAKIQKNQLANGAKQSALKVGEVTITVFTLPKKKDQTESQQAFYFIHQNQLVATDHKSVAEEIVGRFAGQAEGTLAAVKAFGGVMQHCVTQAGDLKPHVRWFVDPFGYVQVTRAASGGRKKRGTDMLKVLANQGFTAVQGLGGFITFATGQHEILHRTFVYAPADGSDHKYRLAARVLDFPNKDNLAPLPWVPRDVAAHLAFNGKIKEGFEYIGTLVDEFAGDKGVFEDVLLSLKTDPNGPKIDMRNELVAFAGERIMLLSDHRMPITPKCERIAVAIEVTDMKAVQKAINKIMESDPNATKLEYKGHTIWEIINDDQSLDDVDVLMVDDGFTAVKTAAKDEDEKETKPIIPNAAVTIVHGHLLVATHLDFIRDLLNQPVGEHTLADAVDYKLVHAALTKLGAGTDAAHYFVRTDEAYRPTYELLKQGQMPQAETLVGKALNSLLAPDEEGAVREQEIDGSKLPDYQAVRRYLGPAGLYVRTEKDGWSITGCLLSKEAEQPAAPPAATEPEKQPE